MSYLAPLPVVIPLGMAALLAAFNEHISRRVADAAAILASATAFSVAIQLMLLSRHAPILYWFGGWTPRSGAAIGISFTIDPIGAGLAAFAALLTLAALVFSLRYFKAVGTLYHALMLGFLAGMCGFSLTGDLFNMFVFFELMSASAFALCGYKNEEESAQQGALNFAITNTIGAFLVLIGIALLYSRTGALNMAQIGRSLAAQMDATIIVAFVLIMCGYYVKAAAVPFHFWLADAHAVAPTPVCILFSGIMVELGVYAVARVYWSIMDGPFAAHRPALSALLLTVGTVTAVVGAIMCFGQRHIKRLLAFSTISHVGLLVIAFALLTPDGLAGGAIYTLGHGMVKSALFIVAGILLHRYGTVDEYQLQGRARKSPWTGIIFFAAGLGLAGMAPFGTFLGDHAIEHSAEITGRSWIAIVFFFAGAVTAAAVFRVAGRVFLGWGPKSDEPGSGGHGIKEERETSGNRRGVPAVMFIPALLLLLLALAIGVIPHLEQHVRAVAFTMADRAGYQARVMDDSSLPDLEPEPESLPLAGSLARSLGATATALVLAWIALAPWYPRKNKAFTPLLHAMQFLRNFHTGHVGDYVAFLTFGVAVFGLVLGVLIKFLHM
ncbi:MAG TPA: proton-conducting transporter membrane subunit [Terriglobales bacterium]|nr:proton-conducting transporter membrane subunit [Terriglobales bacterium]